MMKLTALKIDPEFQGKIPPLTSEELDQLEKNIVSDGKVINPIIVWNGLIIDGHKGGLVIIVYVTKNFGFRRGEIYFADLDPHYGSEQGGKRPVIVIQNNTGNKFSPTVIVAAVTSKISKKPNQPTHVLIDKNPAFNRPSVVLLEQLFTIDKERINNFMGLTSDWEMAQIEKALKCSLALDQENLVKNDSKTA